MTATVEERLGVGMDAIREFCEKWGIIEFVLLGSVLRDDSGVTEAVTDSSYGYRNTI